MSFPLFDPDQTHDLLWCQRLPSHVAPKITAALTPDHSLPLFPMPIALIERVIVGANLPWADDWTGQVFEFLRWLSQTSILFDPFLSGTVFGFEYPDTIDPPDTLNLPSFPNSLTVRVEAGQSGSITWLERSHHEVSSAPYCADIATPITVWVRQGRQITAGKEAKEVTLDSRYWLHNSVVLTNAELIGVTAQERKIIEYNSLAWLLAEIQSQLDLPPVKYLENFNLWRS